MIQRLVILFLLFFSARESFALDFKTGSYDLIKGDENICVEGPLLIKGDQLSLGGKLTFTSYKKPTVEFLNDEKDCKYLIANKHTEKSYEQQTTITCQKNPVTKKVIRFHYKTADTLIMEISSEGNHNLCELQWKK